MTPNDFFEAALKRRPIENASQAHGPINVVSGITRLKLVEEPKSLL
jgi:hypothetical protein